MPVGGLFTCCCIFSFAASRNDLLLGLTTLPARSFEWKERLNMVTAADGVVYCQRASEREASVKMQRVERGPESFERLAIAKGT